MPFSKRAKRELSDAYTYIGLTALYFLKDKTIDIIDKTKMKKNKTKQNTNEQIEQRSLRKSKNLRLRRFEPGTFE